MYSLSKALLNSYTRIKQGEINKINKISSINAINETNETNEKNENNENNEYDDTRNSIQIFSVCPGNFKSPMSTLEELESAVPVDDASQQILSIALNPHKYVSGRFYRNCEEIPW